MTKQVLYGQSNYGTIVHNNGYFVDKTEYIAKLERIGNPIFLRPRRFGKSMFCSILRHYYDLNFVDQFDELFGHTWIGQNPTGQQNQYMVLPLNFSRIETGPTIQDIEKSFKRQCNTLIDGLRDFYPSCLGAVPKFELDVPVSDNLSILTTYIWTRGLPPLYIIIDEYDNFANQLITGNQAQLYDRLTDDTSFFKTFFKVIKEGREMGAVENVFITGVLPVLIDELSSAFNVGSILTLRAEFEAMIGFTQQEVDQLLDEVYTDYDIDPQTRPIVNATIKNHYNGYYFSNREGDGLYNSTILMYFLEHFTSTKEMPEFLTDQNLRTDLSWVRRLTNANPGDTEAFVAQLTTENRIAYNNNFLTTKFNTSHFFKPDFYPVSFFHLGMLTRKDRFYLQLPNLNMQQIFVEYFNELHHIDISTRYAEIMQTFANRPNLEELFAGYWREYVSQLPEAIFTKMNENFYRTTFYQLCNEHLSHLFTWNVERSYPSGKSDLEFVGKYHEKYAGLRWVIEFKYYSNSELRKLKTTIEKFELKAEDTEQIAGYVDGLRKEYPEAQIEQYVIYCFGNQGFRVFTV